MSPALEARLRAQPTADLSEGAKEHLRIVGHKKGIRAATLTLLAFRSPNMGEDADAWTAFTAMPLLKGGGSYAAMR